LIPTPEEKQHIIDLVWEIREVIQDLPDIKRLPESERAKRVQRINEIRIEMTAYREKYPND